MDLRKFLRKIIIKCPFVQKELPAAVSPSVADEWITELNTYNKDSLKVMG